MIVFACWKYHNVRGTCLWARQGAAENNKKSKPSKAIASYMVNAKAQRARLPVLKVQEQICVFLATTSEALLPKQVPAFVNHVLRGGAVAAVRGLAPLVRRRVVADGGGVICHSGVSDAVLEQHT